LPLIPQPANDDANAAPVEEGSDSSPQASVQGTFALQAPLRLNPLVRDALANAVRTLNEGMGPPIVCTVAEGLFVPLDEFVRRGVQPSLAMRALSETSILVKQAPDGPPTHFREFNGHQTIGIVLDPRYVSGLDPAAFAASPKENS